jgi:hypothetical protein
MGILCLSLYHNCTIYDKRDNQEKRFHKGKENAKWRIKGH